MDSEAQVDNSFIKIVSVQEIEGSEDVLLNLEFDKEKIDPILSAHFKVKINDKNRDQYLTKIFLEALDTDNPIVMGAYREFLNKEKLDSNK